MRIQPLAPGRTLAIDPCRAGFGFAVLEEPERLIDWGVNNCARRRGHRRVARLTRYRAALASVVVRHHPSRVLVRYDPDRPSGQGSVIAVLEGLSLDHGFELMRVRTEDVRAVFDAAGVRTKDQLALLLSKRFPVLLPLPKPRGRYRSEDYRMNIYDAVAIALAGPQLAQCPKSVRAP